MLIRQSINTFIRIYDNGQMGYIVNQLTMFDRCYNDIGADFLSQISRTPQDVDTIIENLMSVYVDVDKNELSNDFNDFICDLESNHFVVTGNSEEELELKDEVFTYNVALPKTRVNKFTQILKDEPLYDTQSYLSVCDVNPRIVDLHLELTTRCNERCVHCYIPNKVKTKGIDMPLIKVKKLIDDFCEMNGLHIVISGGESLLHKHINEILYYCRKKDLKISILSNFLVVDETLANTFKNVGLSNAKVSLYSMDATIHDSITQIPGSFEKTKAAIELLHSLDVPLEISCPLLKENYKGYKDVMKYAYSLKIKANTDFNLLAESDFNKDNLVHNISLQDKEIVLRDILENDDNYVKMIVEGICPNNDNLPLSDTPICGAGRSSLCVTPSGDVYPCAGWGGEPLGNVFINGLEDIWNSNEKLSVYRNITYSSFPKCLNCEAVDYCSICLCQNFNESNGNVYTIPNRVCDTAFLNMRIVEEFKKKMSN